MTATDSGAKDDALSDSARDVADKEKDRDRPAKSKNAASKSKDLSHVPCKFFKVGSCTAGSSCPFSHTILEPGQQKEVCAWFVKGNCKFGHKCALAHILPGQSMSMDRKNKKAAQAAANANSTGAARDGSRQGRPPRNPGSNPQGSSGAISRNPLMPGSTAPTRSHSSSRPPIPMPLKATLSPSTPAPPVHATDFASYGLPDESNKLPSAPAQSKHSAPALSSVEVSSSVGGPSRESGEKSENEVGSSGPGPAAVDFGPIGSPPRMSSSVRIGQLHDASPGTSPRVAVLSSSPFSAPGTQSTFMLLSEQKDSSDFRARSGLSASLGAMLSWNPHVRGDHVSDVSSLPLQRDEVVVEDGDLEEFIPGSLSELLTPEEKSRRFSRTNAARPLKALERETSAQSSAEGAHHRHSRSVPAPSLMQEIRSIWTENTAVGSVDSGATGMSVTGGGLGNGTPSSFQSNSGFDILAPSNASAAFLPGLHHFINAKSTQRSNLTSGMSNLYAQPSTGIAASHHPTGLASRNGLSQSPSRPSPFTSGSAYDVPSIDQFSSAQTQHHASGRPILGNDEPEDRRNAFSPSTRALQAHAPGQSLPQGLAAGYSRIHALPPPPAIPSPSTSGAFSPGRSIGLPTVMKGSLHTSHTSAEWHSSSPPAGFSADSVGVAQGSPAAGPAVNGSLGGLDSMFSRLSYSAATSRTPAAATPSSRNVSGRTWQNAQGPLSPLSGPVLTGDDDDLFSMDG